MKRRPTLTTLDEMEAIRRAYRIDELATILEDMRDERDGLRGDLVDAGELMLRAVEGCPDALDDMKSFLIRPHRNIAST
jgi:hypothetical protein